MRSIGQYLKDNYTDEELCKMWKEMTIEPIEVIKGNISGLPIGTEGAYVGTLWQELAIILADKYVESKRNIQFKAELERKRALIDNIYLECKNILRGFIWQNLGIDMSSHSMELSQLTDIYKVNYPDNTRFIEEANKIVVYYNTQLVKTEQEILETQEKFKEYIFNK